MHFGHPRTTTAFKNQNFLKIWVFQGFPYTRLGPDLVILSPFWGIKFQNPCKKCPSHGEKNLKIFLFFKNVPNSPRIHFGRLKTIRNLQKPIYMKNIWKPMHSRPNWTTYSAFRLIYICYRFKSTPGRIGRPYCGFMKYLIYLVYSGL